MVFLFILRGIALLGAIPLSKILFLLFKNDKNQTQTCHNKSEHNDEP